MLPIVVGSIAFLCAVLRRWKIAAFLVFALGVESASYRLTTLVIHSHRPTSPVSRTCPSMPATRPVTPPRRSRSTVDSALLITSKVETRCRACLVWTFAVAIGDVRRALTHVSRHASPGSTWRAGSPSAPSPSWSSSSSAGQPAPPRTRATDEEDMVKVAVIAHAGKTPRWRAA